MSGRYAPDLTKASAGIPELIGDFEFKVNDAKQFMRKSNDPQTQEEKEVFGIMYLLQVVKADENEKLLGKTIPMSLYFHTEGTEGMNKRFLMAALGFAINDEDNFNAKYSDANWSFIDGDAPQDKAPLPKDSIWAQVIGGRVAATCTVKPNPKDPTQKNQRYDWRPFS